MPLAIQDLWGGRSYTVPVSLGEIRARLQRVACGGQRPGQCEVCRGGPDAELRSGRPVWHRDVVKRCRARQGVVMARQRQANVDRGPHGDRCRSLLRPIDSIGGAVSCEGVPGAHQSNPVGSAQAGRVAGTAGAPRSCSVLECNTISRRHRDIGVRSVCSQESASFQSKGWHLLSGSLSE